MVLNLIEQEYSGKNYFLNEEYLEVNYCPERILHRNEELAMLTKIFVKLFDNPFLISRKVLIQGEIGIGKTLVAHTFTNMLLKTADLKSLKIKSVYINCRNERTSYKILYTILKNLGFQVPVRGYSPQELFMFLQENLEKNEIYLFLILDELNYIDNSNFDLIYSLTRLNDTLNPKKNYLSIISIVRNISLLSNFDDSTLSTLQGSILTLKKYMKSQIIDILSERIKISVKKGVFPSNYIEYIANYINDSGDIRIALNIIRNAIKIAESKNHISVVEEDLKDAINTTIPSIQDDVFNILNIHQIILLKSIIELIQQTNVNQINIVDLKRKYSLICILNQITPRKNTQIWQNLQNLSNFNFIKIELKTKNKKGRSSYISLQSFPRHILEKEINLKLKHSQKYQE